MCQQNMLCSTKKQKRKKQKKIGIFNSHIVYNSNKIVSPIGMVAKHCRPNKRAYLLHIRKSLVPYKIASVQQMDWEI